MGHRKKSFVDQSMLQAGEGRLALHFSRLRWLGVWAPTAFGGLLLWFTLAFHHILPLWLLVLLVLVISAAGAALFSWLVFAQILQREETLNVHARQQAAVAALGQRALARTDLSILMNDAVALVAHTLDVEFCKVLELLPDGTALLLRAGVGWKDGSVGSATVGAGTDSQAGYTLLSNEPVIVEDLRTEPRFSGPPLLRDHGVVSGMSVIIPGADRPFGVLGAHTTRRRTFTTDESHFLQAVANVLATAVERKRAEEALREMNVALAHAMPAISRLDPEGRYVHVNDTYARMIGYEPSEMVGMDWALTVHPDDRGNAITTYHRMVSEGTAEFEARAVRKDGSMFYKHVLMVKIVDKDDTFVGHHCFMRDITARRRAAEALRESEARKGAILESALDCIVTIDHEGMIIEFNPAAERMFGYTRAEVMGKAMAEVIIPPALRDRHRRGLAHYLATGEGPVIGKRLEMPAMRADGTEFPVELAITRIRLEGPPMFTGYLRDITERKRAEETLHALYRASLQIQEPLGLRQRLERLLQTAQTLLELDRINILLADPEGRMLQAVASHGVEEPLEAIQVPIGPEGGGIAQAYLTRRMIVWDGLAPVPQQLRLQPPYDRIAAFRSQVFANVPLVVQGRAIGVLGADRKRTRRPLDAATLELLQLFASQAALAIEHGRLYETQRMAGIQLQAMVEGRTRELQAANVLLQEAMRQAQEASRHKSEFLATMSHELRTPLNSILGFSKLLQDPTHGSLNEKQARYVQNILVGGQHLLALINDLLDLSKVEAGKLELQPETFFLPDAIKAAFRIIWPQAEAKQQVLELRVADDLPTIRADLVRFTQILCNLLSNAVKFTPDAGRITVTAQRGSRGEGPGARDSSLLDPTPYTLQSDEFVELAVQDTGIGIKAEHLPKLFQPFTQLEHTLTRQAQGTGLGLALTRHLVELHGGTIYAKSAGEGRGSTFTVRLPLAPRESPETRG